MAALLVIADCSGGTLPAAPTQAGLGTAQKLHVRFSIRVPRKPHHTLRGTRYISPNTQSIAISIATTSGVVAAKLNANLTPTGGGCTTLKGATVCQKSVALAPGAYAATVDTYDQQNEGGNVLSEGLSLPLAVVTGKTNDVSLVLSGVPHLISITAGAQGIAGSQAAGFTLFGPNALAFTITAKDADNNTIVGDKSLSYTASIESGSGWAVQATPKPTSPNTFTLTPPGTSGSTATVKLTFNYSAPACAQSGAVCSVTFGVKNRIQILAVTDCEASCGGTGADKVLLFNIPFTAVSSYGQAPFATITSGVVDPVAVAVDSAGTLFVANCQKSCSINSNSDTITIYQPPYSGTPTTIATGVTNPTLLAFDSGGDLFVNNCTSCLTTSASSTDVVTMYSHTTNYGGTPLTVSSAAIVAGMTVDPNQNLLIAACLTSCGGSGADAIWQYAAPYTGTATTISNGVHLTGNNAGGLASQFVFDASGDLWSLNCNGCTSSSSGTGSATRYAPPFNGGSNPTNTLTAGLPLFAAAVDGSANVFLASGDGTTGSVSEYLAPSFSGGGTQLFVGANYQTVQMAVDGLNDLILSDGSSVQIASPPYSAMNQIATNASPNGNQPFSLSP